VKAGFIWDVAARYNELMTESTPVRVRIAPSPTGFLHVGTVRTALYNYLFAKKEGGIFVVRIENTDVERSQVTFEQDILEGLKKIGIVWDEGPDVGGPYGPYRQSERQDIYERYLKRLLEEKRAYWCFCAKEELEEEKKAMLAAGVFPKYSGTCRDLSDEAIVEKGKNRAGVIRLVVPANMEIDFSDLVRGKVVVNTDTIGDFVIARSLQSPLYNFAVVIDDVEMRISHVIRGEDHVSNTPRQILIQRALGIEQPRYAHLPLILAPDRSKLSKRNLETSLNDYLKEGFVPEALVNFLALLGWHPEGDQELLSMEELIEQFSLKRVQKGGAVFDMEKLEWFNAQYIKTLPLTVLTERVMQFIPQQWHTPKSLLRRAVTVERDRMKRLTDFHDLARFFFVREEYDALLLRWQEMEDSAVRANLEAARAILVNVSEKDFSAAHLERMLMPLADERGRGEVLWPLRVALSGQRSSPGPFEIMEVLGKRESVGRINVAIGKFDQQTLV